MSPLLATGGMRPRDQPHLRFTSKQCQQGPDANCCFIRKKVPDAVSWWWWYRPAPEPQLGESCPLEQVHMLGLEQKPSPQEFLQIAGEEESIFSC